MFLGAPNTVLDRLWTPSEISRNMIKKKTKPKTDMLLPGNVAVLPGFCSFEKLQYVEKSKLVESRIKRKPGNCPLVVIG